MTSPAEKRVRRKTFTDTTIANLQRKPKRYIIADPEQRGLYIRVMTKGAHVFACVARNPFGKQIWATIGTTSDFTVDEAREKARAAIRRIRKGETPFPAPKLAPDSVAVVCQGWLERVAIKNQYRTAAEKKRVIAKYIVPHFKNRAFVDLRRSDITALLDYIEDHHGSFQADAVLSLLRAVALWVAKRDDAYQPPFVKGMARTSAKARARDRILTDDELRAVWHAADSTGTHGVLVKLLLLTAQRRGVVLNMKWGDIDLASGVWNVPLEDERAKGTGGELRLPALALDIIRQQPRLVGHDYVLVQRGMNLERAKKRLDQVSGIHGYTLHDLRRTSRSLLPRAGVSTEVAERILGHAVRGVEGIYNRHDYFDEKGEGLARLAVLIRSIIDPPPDNVVPLREVVS